MNILRYIFFVIAMIVVFWLYSGCYSYPYNQSKYFDLQFLQDSGLYIATYKTTATVTLFDSIVVKHDSMWLIQDFTISEEGNIERDSQDIAFIIPAKETKRSLYFSNGNGVVYPLLINNSDSVTLTSDTLIRKSSILRTQYSGRTINNGIMCRSLGYILNGNEWEADAIDDTVVMRFREQHPDVRRIFRRFVPNVELHYIRQR